MVNSEQTQKKIQQEKIKKINQTFKETQVILEDTKAQLIKRGQRIETVKNHTGKMAKDSKKLKQEAEIYYHWVEYKKHRSLVIIGGLIVGAVYAVFAGFAWPLVLITTLVGGGVGLGLSWIAFNIKRAIDKMGCCDASSRSVSCRVPASRYSLSISQPTPLWAPCYTNLKHTKKSLKSEGSSVGAHRVCARPKF